MITSNNNEKVKHFVKLRNSKGIKEYGLYIVEGEHLVTEAIKMGIVKELILLEGYEITTTIKTTYVNNQVLKKISLLDSVPKIMAVCRVLEEKEIGNKIIILDNVSDPGNVGTIIRNAVAFNIDTIILSEDSVNKYNDKLIRATQGMFFKVNIITRKLNEVIPIIQERKIEVIGTSLNTFNKLEDVEKKERYALVFGNEGSGISEYVEEMCDTLLFIPISENCESLNVACASAIALYYMEN